MFERPIDDNLKALWRRPAIVFAAALVLTLLLWGLQERSHRERLHLETEVTAEQVGKRLSDWMEDRMSLSAFLAEKWESAYAGDVGLFERDAARFIGHFPGLQAINWIDPDEVIRVVVPREGNASALNVDLKSHPSVHVRNAIGEAMAGRPLARTAAVIDLLQGGKGFATYRPINSENGARLGYINSVFRVNELIDTCLGQRQVGNRFHFAIRESNGDLVYPLGADPNYLLGPLSAVETVNVADLPWKFYLAPTPEYVREQQFSAHHLILPVGLIVALILAGFERGRMLRKRALHSSQAQYRALFEQAPIAYFSVLPDSAIERANRVAETMTGLPVEALVGSSFYDLLSEESAMRTRARLALDAVRHGDPIRSVELSMRRLGAGDFRAVLYVDGVYAEGGAFSMFRIAAVDVNERYEAEEARMRLSAAIDQSEEGVVITGRSGEILYVNPAAGSVPECSGTLADFLEGKGTPAATIAQVSSAITGEVSWRGSCSLRRADGRIAQSVSTLSPVRDGDGTVINFVFIQRDISHEVELQAQLQQSQKLEAVGRLAGGIAHDFNNILQSLLGYATLARRNVGDPEDVAQCLSEIERAGHRAATLVAHILAFGRQSVLDRRAILLRPVVEEVSALVRGSLPQGVDFNVIYSEVEHAIMADSTQFHQVLMNLVSNALHALRAGGSLEVRYEAVNLGDEEAARWPTLSPGPHMRLMVGDDGVGMEPEVLERIFEPYFSTREVGTGTGLGLATVHGIVENHGGAISAESAPGKGARFTILLPAAPGEGSEVAVLPATAEDGASAFELTQEEAKLRVLYVDDEAQIVDSMRRVLERFGFDVSGFTSSTAALESFQNDPMGYDFLVTDLTMPVLNGVDLAEAIVALRPGLPVILCSGYGDSFEKNLDDGPKSIRVFLKKPVSARALAAEIRRLAACAESAE